MKPSMSRSRKTLHLPLHRHCGDTEKACSETAQIPAEAALTPMQKSDRDGKSGRVIEVRYRCGRAIDPIVVSTATDMRKRFFSSASTHALN